MGSNKTTEILVPYAFEALEPPPEPVSLTAAVYEPGGPVVAVRLSHASASTDSNPHYRLDGGEPSATAGHTVPPGPGLFIHGGAAIRNLRIVEPDETNGVFVTYYRGGN